MSDLPALREFRIETTADGVLHLVFDMPGRSMNVFTNAAIHEIDAFATWLKGSEVRGVVVRSGKASAFCAGADLGELGEAYAMIMAAPRGDQKRLARDHFAPIGRAFRKLETAGKPVAVAINGLALGGGCEFAMGCHHRVLADTPRTALGLPESLVGLLPGGGGTQRMPRLVGLDKALPILLDGARLSPAEALAARAADAVVPAGEEVAAAEVWVRAASDATQPWDREGWDAPSKEAVEAALAPVRTKVLRKTGGHYPAPLAILDCLERGLPQPMDAALADEIDIFADLIRRPEPRNMIRTLFLGKQDHDRRLKAGGLPPAVAGFVADVERELAAAAARLGDRAAKARAFAGFGGAEDGEPMSHIRDVPWFEQPTTPVEQDARTLLDAAAAAAARHAEAIPEGQRGLADYAAVKALGFPAYLGGPFALAATTG